MYLSEQQKRFVAFLKDVPAEERSKAKTAAALHAGYSEQTAREQASRLFRNPKIIEALKDEVLPVSVTQAARAVSKVHPPVSPAEDETAFGLGDVQDSLVPLTDRHFRFCLEYLKDGNATQAYLRVYPGSSYEAARASAHELLTNPNIRAHIRELEQERSRRLKLSADRVLSAIMNQAFYDPRDLFDSDWRLKPFEEIPPDAASLIQGFTTKATVTGDDKDGICVTTNVKLPDKTRALELLGRHLKLFTDKLEVTEDTEFAKRLAAAVKAQREAQSGKK